MIVLTIVWFIATFISVGVFAFAFWMIANIANIVIPIGVVVIVAIVLMAIAFYVVASFMD